MRPLVSQIGKPCHLQDNGASVGFALAGESSALIAHLFSCADGSQAKIHFHIRIIPPVYTVHEDLPEAVLTYLGLSPWLTPAQEESSSVWATWEHSRHHAPSRNASPTWSQMHQPGTCAGA